jgi:hypothetical protein
VIELQAKPLPVRQQEDRGTCVGFATAAAHELVRSEEEVLSPEDVMWAAHELMGRATGDETSVELALFGLDAEEEATEAAWPYGNPHWSSGRPEPALQATNRRSLPAWRRLEAVSIPVLRRELQSGAAIILTIGVVKPVWLDPPNGLIDAGPEGPVRGNHAVAVVGASDEKDSVQLLRIKNSWGERWAEEGYASITERYLLSYSICAHALEGGT